MNDLLMVTVGENKKCENRFTYLKYCSISWDVLQMESLSDWNGYHGIPLHKIYVFGIFYIVYYMIYLVIYTYLIQFALFPLYILGQHKFPSSCILFKYIFVFCSLSPIENSFYFCTHQRICSSIQNYSRHQITKRQLQLNVKQFMVLEIDVLKVFALPMIVVCTLTYGYTPKSRTIDM